MDNIENIDYTYYGYKIVPWKLARKNTFNQNDEWEKKSITIIGTSGIGDKVLFHDADGNTYPCTEWIRWNGSDSIKYKYYYPECKNSALTVAELVKWCQEHNRDINDTYISFEDLDQGGEVTCNMIEAAEGIKLIILGVS